MNLDIGKATASFTEIDVVVCLVILACTVGAFLRGFTKETLSLATYIGAAYLTLMLYPSAVSFSEEVFKKSMVMNAGTVIVLFLFVLIFFSIISAMILDNMREFRLGAFDRSLGLLFGLAKGFLIVGALHYGAYVMNGDEDPKMLAKGETYKLTKTGREVVENLMGDYINAKREKDEENSIIPAYGESEDEDESL